MEEIVNSVNSIIIEQLKVEKGNITEESRFIEDLGADSLDLVELIMALEEKFEVQIPDEDAEKVKTVGDAVRCIVKIIDKKKMQSS